jgi:hypothetical protein
MAGKIRILLFYYFSVYDILIMYFLNYFYIEDYASNNSGWTTTRHHAVPTTDLPVYAVKPLLDWFNSKLEQIIMPMLKLQFLNNNETCNNSKIVVHDAFIVKYQNDEEVIDMLNIEEKVRNLLNILTIMLLFIIYFAILTIFIL